MIRPEMNIIYGVYFCLRGQNMPEGIIRHMFAGGNTPGGFFSYYHNIIPHNEARKIYILKGGPGTGKSSLMRKIGLVLAKHGYDAEFMHCSSDNNSLDGIVIPRLGLAMIDGTSPHIVDPVYPGAVDEIINLGQFWNTAGFSESRDEIILLNKKIKRHFTSAYRYLNAASSLKQDTEAIFEEALDAAAESRLINELIQTLFGKNTNAGSPKKRRRLFASAITPRGFSDFLDSICSTCKIIRLSAPAGSSTRHILEVLSHEAAFRGFAIETYFCPMDPLRIEHMVIPELKLSVVTANEYHDVSDINNENCTTYFMNELYGSAEIEDCDDQLSFNRQCIETLFQQAIKMIAQAKATHDELEKHYIKNMDFIQQFVPEQ